MTTQRFQIGGQLVFMDTTITANLCEYYGHVSTLLTCSGCGNLKKVLNIFGFLRRDK